MTSTLNGLPPAGHADIDWAMRSMPLLADSIAQDSPGLHGRHIGICIHVEPKTAVLCRWLLQQGASVTLTGNIGTTHPDTADALRAMGVTVIGTRHDGQHSHARNLNTLLAAQPDLIMDNGGELIERLVHGAPRSPGFLGATEETTTGGRRVRALPVQPDFPVIVINDSYLKLLVENEFGVGQSVVQGFMNTTNSMIPGTRAAVVGYGPCGKGVAETLSRLGAQVSVADIDPYRALEAVMRGHRVAPLRELLPDTQLLFLATGGVSVIGTAEIGQLRDGVIIAGVSHEATEVDWQALKEHTAATRSLSSQAQDQDARVVYELSDGREIVVLYGTRMINLTAAGGNPIQAMDLGLSLQARSLAAIARGDANWHGARPVPANVDTALAQALVKLLSSR